MLSAPFLMPGKPNGRDAAQGRTIASQQGNSVDEQCQVRVRFCPPPAELRRYFTTFYLVELAMPQGGLVADWLHPEWGNLRFHQGTTPSARTLGGSQLAGSDFAVTGPSSESVHFTIGPTRMWGIGLLPLGWARFVGVPACDLADSLIAGNSHPAFESFRPLARTLFEEAPDPDAELERIVAHFRAQAERRVPDAELIVAIHAALIDPRTATVPDLRDKAGVSPRALERLCDRAFGFPPKLLLRRQRFLRSLADFMLAPSLKWVGAIDSQYHDQAQFVRDFHRFMGMTPRQYAALPKPVLSAMVHERARFAGKAVQALEGPDGVQPGA